MRSSRGEEERRELWEENLREQNIQRGEKGYKVKRLREKSSEKKNMGRKEEIRGKDIEGGRGEETIRKDYGAI